MSRASLRPLDDAQGRTDSLSQDVRQSHRGKYAWMGKALWLRGGDSLGALEPSRASRVCSVRVSS